MAEILTPSVSREPFNRVVFHSVEFHFANGAVNGLTAYVSFGRNDEDENFVERRSVELNLDRNALMTNLSADERAALASIKTKLMAVAKAEL